MLGLCSSSVLGFFHLIAGLQRSMSIVHCTFCTERPLSTVLVITLALVKGVHRSMEEVSPEASLVSGPDVNLSLRVAASEGGGGKEKRNLTREHRDVKGREYSGR